MDEDLGSSLWTALDRGELFAVFQPQVDLADGSVVGAEVLCRWRHPRLGLVPPKAFIPVAEETGAIAFIGRFILGEALTAIAAWHDDGFAVEVSVNVSPVQLASDEFVRQLRDDIADAELPPGGLTVEITESRSLGDLHEIVRSIESLRDVGVGVALDDFGTGHASQRHLEELPFTELKLDRSLIQSAASENQDELRDALELAHSRDLRVVAEGIESPSHLRRAQDLECDRGQGFLLGLPMSRTSFDALLAG